VGKRVLTVGHGAQVSGLAGRKRHANQSAIDRWYFFMKIAVATGVVMKFCACAYKCGWKPTCSVIFARAFAITVYAGGFLAAFAMIGVRAQPPQTAITCTNPYSGATWQINVDYDRGTVDSAPAQISDATISWQAENGWKYSLDRKSGKLTVTLASSTGGNFLYDQCKLDK
jgi:hypothetical protein